MFDIRATRILTTEYIAKQENKKQPEELIKRIDQQITSAATEGKRSVNIYFTEDEKQSGDAHFVASLLRANSFRIGPLTDKNGFWSSVIMGRTKCIGITVSWPNEMPGIMGA